MTMFIPVVDSENRPLMPTTPARARKWVKSGKATAFFKKGLFCVRLNVEPSGRILQEIAVGIDPGSKKEAFTIKSESHTYLSVQTDAVTWVKDAVGARRSARRSRRQRKTPCRKNKRNRSRGALTPSTKARWGLKIRISQWLCSVFPIGCFVVENIAAQTLPGQRRWNASFSPLEVGKRWFYDQLQTLARLETREGWETAEYRVGLKLVKTSNKLSNDFSAHCVDSWVLANEWVGGHTSIDNTHRMIISPFQFHRRQLHAFQFAKGGVRRNYGSTQSLGFKRGSLVIHPKHGKAFVGGFSKGKISLKSTSTNQRVTQKAKVEVLVFKSYYSWSYFNIPSI